MLMLIWCELNEACKCNRKSIGRLNLNEFKWMLNVSVGTLVPSMYAFILRETRVRVAAVRLLCEDRKLYSSWCCLTRNHGDYHQGIAEFVPNWLLSELAPKKPNFCNASFVLLITISFTFQMEVSFTLLLLKSLAQDFLRVLTQSRR